MNWNKVKLGDVCEPVSTWNPKSADEETFSYIDIASIDREQKTIGEVTQCENQNAPSRARQLVETDDVLISTVRPNLNAVARVGAELNGATASTGFCVLRATNNAVSSRFLFHWVKTPAFIEDMVKQATGQSYPAVSDRIIKDSEISLPPLAEQQRLAAILDEADALRALRRDGVAALDELAQSLFLELFGDPATNPKNWEMVNLGDTTEVVGGYAFPSASFAEEGTGIVRISNIQNGKLALDGMARIPECKIGSGRNYRVKPNVILIAMSGATTGKIAVTPNDPNLDLLLNQRVGMFVSDDSQITLEYLQLVLVSSFYQRFVRDQAGGVAQPNISAKKLESAQIPLPPLALQQEFAQQIGQLETLKSRARAQAVELDALFGALSARAFAGELSKLVED